MLAAVPSQSADAFPAGMLFKTRARRRKDFPRSFTLRAGLQSIPEAIARTPHIQVALGRAVAAVLPGERVQAVLTEDGERHEAEVVAVATPPGTASRILRDAAPELATVAARVKESSVETLGFAVRAEKLSLPTATFLVPRDDAFHSAVTRDSVPDPSWRAFAFHFRPGTTAEVKKERVTAVLKVGRSDLEEVVEKRSTLPSPVLGHEEIVREIDRLSSGSRVRLTGNWFLGLSIEDCVERSRQEWARVAALTS
jgi:UDP-galactopyranose mutase